MIKLFKSKNQKKKLLSFTEKGYLHIDSTALMKTKGFQRQLKAAEELAKKLNLKTFDGSN